jgi:polyisoprenoid-binding protein YceI
MYRSLLPTLLVFPGLSTQAADLYRLDSGNTHVSLDVRIFGVPWISARFEDISGELVPGTSAKPGNPSAASTGRVDVTIRTASLRCESTRWNARLLSPAWFDAVRYPQIVFRSDHVDVDADGRAVVSGHLTMHGYTRDLVLLVNRWNCPDDASPRDTCSFDAHGRLRRSDYDLPHGLFEGGDEVEISIEGVNAGPQAQRSAGARSWQ